MIGLKLPQECRKEEEAASLFIDAFPDEADISFYKMD